MMMMIIIIHCREKEKELIKKKMKGRKDQKKPVGPPDDSNLLADGAVVAKVLRATKISQVVPMEGKDDEKDDDADMGLEALLALDKGDGKGVKDVAKKSKGASKGQVVAMTTTDGSTFPDEEDDSVVKKREKLVVEKGEKIKCECCLSMHCCWYLTLLINAFRT